MERRECAGDGNAVAAEKRRNVRGSALYNVVDAADECSGIKLAAHHVIGTVADDGDAPVADKGDLLLRLYLLEQRTELIGCFEIALALYVDEDEIVTSALQDLSGVLVAVGTGHFVSGDTQDLVADGAENVPRGDMENGGLRRAGRVFLGMHANLLSHPMPGKLLPVGMLSILLRSRPAGHAI